MHKNQVNRACVDRITDSGELGRGPPESQKRMTKSSDPGMNQSMVSSIHCSAVQARQLPPHNWTRWARVGPICPFSPGPSESLGSTTASNKKGLAPCVRNITKHQPGGHPTRDLLPAASPSLHLGGKHAIDALYGASYRGNLVRAGLAGEFLSDDLLRGIASGQGQRGTTCLLEASHADQNEMSSKDGVLY